MDGPIYVRPVGPARVRLPDLPHPVPREGAWVPDSMYARRRIADGDLEITTPPSAAPAREPRASRKVVDDTPREEAR